jgi:hypothetical protein
VLKPDATLLLQIVQVLLSDGQVSQQTMAQLLGVRVAQDELMLGPYEEQLNVFVLQHGLKFMHEESLHLSKVLVA